MISILQSVMPRRVSERSTDGDDDDSKNRENVQYTNTRPCLFVSGGSYIQPVEDGGYCLLSLPHHIPASAAFANIPWSSSTTCAAQIESITSQGVVVTNPGASRCSVGDGSDENGGISPHSRQDFFDVDTRHDLNKLEEEVFGRFFLGCRLVDIFGAANFEVVQGVGRWTVDFVRKRRVEHKRWFVRAGIAHLIWYALARKRH